LGPLSLLERNENQHTGVPVTSGADSGLWKRANGTSNGLLVRGCQVDPMKPKLKPPGTKRLKLECDVLLSEFDSNLNLRRYIMGLVVDQSVLMGTATSHPQRRGRK
jgi:hypothetical protein